MVTVGVTHDSSAGKNKETNAGGPVPIVDAVNDAVSLTDGGMGTDPLGTNDQVGAGSPPTGSTFTYLGGTCAGASVNGTTGVASFLVPLGGSCMVNYELCYNGACDTATLTVTGTAVLAIPTLSGWGLVALLVTLGATGTVLLRRLKGC